MSGDTQLFPAMSINQFADPVSFVYSWNRLYRYTGRDEDYESLKDKEEWTEEDLLTLFEWFEGKKLSNTRLKVFNEQVAARVRILNVMKQEVDIGDLYCEFGHLDYMWYHFLANLVIDYPLFNRDIYRAFHFINSAEIREFPKDHCEQLEVYMAYVDFYDKYQELTPGCSTMEREIALMVFGRYLRRHCILFLP
jgi:hypothetical protein